MQPRNVAFVGAIGVTIGWLFASTLAPPVARVQSRLPDRNPPRAADEPPASLIVQLEQLDARPLPTTPEGRRNPFVFGARIARPSSTVEPLEAGLQSGSELPAPPPGPSFVLSGIGISGDVRTAVLTATGTDVLLVKVNDIVDGYTVAEISESSVTLTREGERLVLHFRN
jgi:hypothetical protein